MIAFATWVSILLQPFFLSSNPADHLVCHEPPPPGYYGFTDCREIALGDRKF